jgi:hypothetical protein
MGASRKVAFQIGRAVEVIVECLRQPTVAGSGAAAANPLGRRLQHPRPYFLLHYFASVAAVREPSERLSHQRMTRRES